MEKQQLKDQLLQKDHLQQKCSICNKQFHVKDLLSASDNCQHGYCFNCLIKRLQQCLLLNQDMKCPNDACPLPLSNTSNFFTKVPKDIHDKYLKWKLSPNYRPPSFRKSIYLNESIQNKEIQQDINEYVDNKVERQQIKYNGNNLQEQMQERQQMKLNEFQDLIVNRNIYNQRIKQPIIVPIIVIIFRVLISITGLLGLIFISLLFTVLCFLIYACCVLFIFMVILSFAAIVFFFIKQMYLGVVMSILMFIFSLVVSHFYASNFNEITQDITKKGYLKIGTLFLKLIEFPQN